MSRVAMLLAVSVCLALGACDQAGSPGSSGASNQAGDPLASFKGFSQRFAERLKTEFDLSRAWIEEDVGDRVERSLVFEGEPTIDVRRTDSLASPYTGQITMKARQVDKQGREVPGTWSQPIVFAFALQDQRWVVKSVRIENYYYPDYALNKSKLELMGRRGKAYPVIGDRFEAAANAAN